MTLTRIAKNPDLYFLKIIPNEPFEYPYILNSKGKFDWEANSYLVDYGGGNLSYGVKPTTSTIITHARSLSILLSFIEEKKDVNLLDFRDEHFFDYVKYLNTRNVDNSTIKVHCRKAIDYFIYLQTKNADISFITTTPSCGKHYQINVVKKFHNAGGRVKKYYDHKSFENLVTITEEVDYIRDDEFIDWLDAINKTKTHPDPSHIIKLRWQVIGYLLDATGSRISELKDISRSMIKSAYKPLADLDEQTEISFIPVKKGKYKGKFRTIPISNGTIQLVMSYINTIEDKWPNLHHDKLFINVENGHPITGNYLKNYTLSVLKNSIYAKKLRHVHNQSFRHRFITLNVAKNIYEHASGTPFSNLLPIAMNAVRKLTLHASNSTMSTYVHLATNYNNKYRLKNEHAQINALLKNEIKKLKRLQSQFESGQISEQYAFENMLEIVKNI